MFGNSIWKYHRKKLCSKKAKLYIQRIHCKRKNNFAKGKSISDKLEIFYLAPMNVSFSEYLFLVQVKSEVFQCFPYLSRFLIGNLLGLQQRHAVINTFEF